MVPSFGRPGDGDDGAMRAGAARVPEQPAAMATPPVFPDSSQAPRPGFPGPPTIIEGMDDGHALAGPR